mmetsp:Transcript_62547/g.98779  ORF Transcript_62547/g.98779 Transcript_62547/m.98779 type:complete len:391 (-) Transcript_62547:21-1193(-)
MVLYLLSWSLLLASSSATLSQSKFRLRSSVLRHEAQKKNYGLRSRAKRVAGRNMQPEILENWQDSGKAIKTSLTDKQLMDLASPLTANMYGKLLHEVADSQESRFVADSGNNNAAHFIAKRFEALGLSVSQQTVEDDRIKEQYAFLSQLSETAVKHKNVVGFLKGSDLADEVILLGAHYDSVNWEDTSKAAPGVDDNGSGVALMLAVAKLLSTPKFRPRRSVMFVAFNAEEEGCVGSEHLATLFADGEGRQKYGNLKSVFIADEVAWPGMGEGRRRAIFETSGRKDGTNALVDTLAHFALLKNSTSQLSGDGIGDGTKNFLVNYNGFGSDHMSFLDRGIPAVLLIERDDIFHADRWGHSARDTFDHVDFSYGAAMSRLALRAVAAFANPQ